VIFSIFTKVGRVFWHFFGRDFLLLSLNIMYAEKTLYRL